MNEQRKMIESVSDNKDKQATYRELIGRYKRALNQGFYFEAMIIVYAMLEDRMNSFLYYIGAFRNPEDKKMNVEKTKGFLRRLYYGSDELAAGKKLDINQITNKEKLIRATLQYVIECEEAPQEGYLAVLKSEYEGCLDMGGLLQTLDEINDWRRYRNEIIHGLLNKNLESLNADLGERVEAGMRYARFLDSQVKALKKKDMIRWMMRIKR